MGAGLWGALARAKAASLSGQLAGQEQARQQGIEEQMNAAKLKSQSLSDALAEAQANEANARAHSLLNPPSQKPPVTSVTGGYVDENGVFHATAPTPTTQDQRLQTNVDAVRGEHPDWSAEQIMKEARYRTGLTVPQPPMPQTISGTVQPGAGDNPSQLVVTGGPPGEVGKTIPLPSVDKTTGGVSGTGATAVARVFGGIAEMKNARDFMEKYEADLARGYDDQGNPVSLEGAGAILKQTLGALGTDMNHQVAGTPAYAILAQVDPRLADYIRFGTSFAEGEGLISQRPSDFRQKVAQFLSSARAGMGPESFGAIQSRRNAIINSVEGALQNTGGRGGQAAAPQTGGGGKHQVTAAEYEQLKADAPNHAPGWLDQFVVGP